MLGKNNWKQKSSPNLQNLCTEEVELENSFAIE